MSLDALAAASENASWKSRDQPPIWNGEDPARRWRSMRREMVLWGQDTDTLPSRQAVRVFRALQGVAKQLAEPISDRDLMSPNGLTLLIQWFDDLYRGAMELTAEVDFEQAVFNGFRTADESFLTYRARKQLEFARYENGVGRGALPDHLRGKLLLRQAKLNEKQSQR
eukprot:6432221-Amphidinium_carterae.1